MSRKKPLQGEEIAKNDDLDIRLVNVGPELDPANEEDRLIEKFMKKIMPDLKLLGDEGSFIVDLEKRTVEAKSSSGKTKSWNLDKELDLIREEEKVVH